MKTLGKLLKQYLQIMNPEACLRKVSDRLSFPAL